MQLISYNLSSVFNWILFYIKEVLFYISFYAMLTFRNNMYKTHHMLRIFLPTRKDVPKSNIKVTDNAPIKYIRNIGISNMS